MVGESVKAWIYCYDSSWIGSQYIILIDCCNQLFEITLVHHQFKVEFVCERGGMNSGNGPYLLGDLGVLWSLGQVPRTYEQRNKDNLMYFFCDEARRSPRFSEPLRIKGIPFQGIIYKESLQQSVVNEEPGWKHAWVQLQDFYGGCVNWGNGSHGYLPLQRIIRSEISVNDGIIEIPRRYIRFLRSINADTAQWLCKFKKVDLSGLETITAEIAGAFAGHTGILKLDGISELEVDVASEISRHKGMVSLTGLRDLSLGAAQALIDHAGGLNLSPQLSISGEIAEVLSEHSGPIFFRAVGKRTVFTILEAPHAKLLRRVFDGRPIHILDSWTIHPGAVPILAAHPDGLILNDSTRYLFSAYEIRDRSFELPLRS